MNETQIIRDLPEWIRALNPDKISRTEDDSWILEWNTPDERIIDVYDSGTVVTMARDSADFDTRSFCEVSIDDREWIENFARNGWNRL